MKNAIDDTPKDQKANVLFPHTNIYDVDKML